MAYGKRFWVYPAAAVLLAVVIIAGTAVYMSVQTKTAPSSFSVLTIMLTDPPQVPYGTQWLNMTFTQVSLLVAEPAGSGGLVNTKTVTVTPYGGSATIDLLALQNYTFTLAQANLTQGSVVYSVTFTVSKIVIDVNGTQYPVTITGGASTLQAVIANPKSLTGVNDALIELNPVVVNTPIGYQLIPSTVAVIAPSHGQEHEGGMSTLSQQERQELEEATGNLSVKILTLSVSGNTTTFMLLVNNTGGVPVQLVAVGVHGDFNVTGSACRAGGEGENNQTNDNNQTNGMGDHQSGTGNAGDSAVALEPADHGECEHPDQVVFVPLNTSSSQAASTTTSTTTTSTASASSAKCQVFNMSVVNGEDGKDNSQGDENQQSAGIVIQPHECVELVFKGVISFGSSNLTLVPSLATGSTYTIHIIASNSAEQKLECTVPVGPASCKPVTSDNND